MNTAPFSTAFLTCVWLKEPISKVDIIAMFGAYFGIIIVTLKSDGNSSSANLDY
jgi:drug/metabolite transporter (DMT)-like permease